MSNRKKAILLISAGVLVRLIFTLCPWSEDQERLHWFPFFHGDGDWDGRMTLENYVYGYVTTSSYLCFISALWYETGIRFIKVVFLCFVVYLIDYILCYNYTWFKIWSVDIEYNHFMGVIIILYAIAEWENS